MSQPNIPNISPNITLTRDDAVNLILSSIAMEELGLSHILNAEGEKLQYVLGTLPGLTGPSATIEDLLAVNQSIRGTLDSAMRNQMFLQSKMEGALSATVMVGPTGATGPIGPSGGPPGPTGATGVGLDGVTVFDPNNSGSYLPGQVISHDGKLYKVVSAPATGTPGSSSSYQLLLAGVTGATGATGVGLDGSTGFNPNNSGSYTVGQVVYYQGKLYKVVNSPASGVPGTSPDYQLLLGGITGATGATGVGLDGVMAFDPSNSGSYLPGQVISYQGKLYKVVNAPATGVPGSSPDYQLVLAGITGVTGATGVGLDGSTGFNPNNSGSYVVGQVVYYQGKLYKVVNAPASGVPGSSPDYQLMLGGITGATGATGVGLDGSTPFDASSSGGYVVGQVVYYQGKLYKVVNSPASGIPGSSPDYQLVLGGITGATGATGVGLDGVTAYDPNSSAGYLPGQVISYQGKLYKVMNSPATGTPGSSPDYQLLLSGVTGATGATGVGLDGVTAYDPNNSSSYLLGQVISHDGKLYKVVNAPPSGTPGTSADYQLVLAGITGATGATGVGLDGVTAYDPNNSSSYLPGQVISYQGKLYKVVNAPATGIPGSSPDYQLVLAGITGATGATGVGLDGVTAYDPNNSSSYLLGQVISHDGKLYKVVNAPPSGTPGTSADYQLVLAGITGATGATGVGLDGVTAYDPNNSSSYLPGQVISYQGKLYKVVNAPATGIPGSSPDYQLVLAGITGATGATGVGLDGVTAYDPNNSSSYLLGQVISHDGKLYKVVNAPPSGTPGTSADYQLVLAGITGATGVGLDGTTVYDPNNSSSYLPGQVISYDGKLYKVVNAPASGTPGTSADYQLVLAGITGPKGDTGSLSQAYASFWIKEVTAGVEARINLDNANAENSPGFVMSNGLVTVPIAGLYFVSYSISMKLPSDGAVVQVRQNGNATSVPTGSSCSAQSGGGAQGTASRSFILRIAANDTIELWRYSGTGPVTFAAVAGTASSGTGVQLTLFKIAD